MLNSTYKVELYNRTGSFIKDISDLTSIPNVTQTINSGDGVLTLNVDVDFDDYSDLIDVGYEVRVYDIINGVQYKIYSGWVFNITKKLTNDSANTIIELVGFIGRLEKSILMGTGNRFSFTRDGTQSGYFSLDTKKSSDQIKMILNNYRFWNSFGDQINSTGGSNFTLGSTRQWSQAFTTGTDTEVNKLAGVFLQIKYNTGTASDIGVSIKADDGTGKPTGGGLVNALCSPITNTTYNYIPFIFDEPYQLSASTKYHIVIFSGNSSSTSTYHLNGATSGNPYTGGDSVLSTNDGSTWTVQTNQDLIFTTHYVDEGITRINYDSTSIDGTSDSKVYKYTGMNDLGAIEYVNRYAPSEFYYRLDEDNTFQFHPVGFSKSLILNNCDSATGWTNDQGVGSITTNTNNKVEGSSSVQFTLLGSTTVPIIYKNLSPAVDLSMYTNVGCWVYVPLGTTLERLIVRLHSNTQTNYKQWSINPSTLRRGEWNWITPMIRTGDTAYFTSGAFDISAVDRISLVMIVKSSAEASTWYMDDWKAGNIELHSLTRGKDIIDLEYQRDISDITNYYVVTNSAVSNGLIRVYQDDDSVNAYGRFGGSRVDGRLSDSTTMNDIGNAFVAKNSKEKRKLEIRCAKSQELMEVRPGHLVQPVGFESLTGLFSFFVVTQVTIGANTLTFILIELGIDLSDRVSKIEERLELLETYSATTGDVPTSQTNAG